MFFGKFFLLAIIISIKIVKCVNHFSSLVISRVTFLHIWRQMAISFWRCTYINGQEKNISTVRRCLVNTKNRFTVNHKLFLLPWILFIRWATAQRTAASEKHANPQNACNSSQVDMSKLHCGTETLSSRTRSRLCSPLQDSDILSLGVTSHRSWWRDNGPGCERDGLAAPAGQRARQNPQLTTVASCWLEYQHIEVLHCAAQLVLSVSWLISVNKRSVPVRHFVLILTLLSSSRVSY